MINKETEVWINVNQNINIKKIRMECIVLGDLAMSEIVPAAIRYQTLLLNNVNGLRNIFGLADYKNLAGARIELIKAISLHISKIKVQVNELNEVRTVADRIKNEKAKAKEYSKKVLPCFEDIKNHVEQLKLVVNQQIKPLPIYGEHSFKV
jgi:glutamine synthetase